MSAISNGVKDVQSIFDPSIGDDDANIDATTGKLNDYIGSIKGMNQGTQDEYKRIEGAANNVSLVDQPDFSDMDSSMGAMSALANAFNQMFQQGSPVAAAQNAIQAGAQARAAVAPGANPQQVLNNSQSGSAQQVQNAGQQAAQMGQQGQSAMQTNAATQLQQQALQAQVIHANAQAAIQKRQLASQAQLSASGSLEAQQDMINKANNSMTQMQQNGAQQDFNNMLQGVQTFASGLAQVGSSASSALKANNVTGEGVSESQNLAQSGYNQTSIPDYTSQVTDVT